ncbi:hypothetical protein ABCS02_08605 [Microbacterium sp. X-17]|uniref:hypothetical protein n=1 Tax=Microbacterium sp. X-17 TaxID=3144404 RepID=UPI0031F553FA
MYLGVDWSEREAHMEERHGVTVEQAEEALADPRRIVFEPDYASRSGRSVRVIGYSRMRAQCSQSSWWSTTTTGRNGVARGGPRMRGTWATTRGTTMSKISDLLASEVEAAEQASADPATPLPKGVRVTRGHDRTRVLQVRLSEEEYAAVSERADAHHVPASTLARDVLLRNLESV